MSRKRVIGAVVAVVALVGGALLLVDGDDDAAKVSAGAGSSTTASTSTTTTTNTTAPAAPAPTEPPATTAPAPADPPPSLTPISQIAVGLTEIVTLDQPIAMVARPGSGELWVAEQGGRVVTLVNGAVPVDISTDTENNGEQGLLGMAFDASGTRLYLSYTDNAGDSRVHEFAVSPAGAVDTTSRRELLFVDQPYANHNGGNLALGPDGAIWLGLGDGGSGGDPQGHAQRDGDPLGKLLRLPPGGSTFEIVAKGLRNPWRFSFDRTTSDLWLGDVGQSNYEEINAVGFGSVAGANFGWNRREGAHSFAGGSEPGDVEPLFEYTHGRGCSVTGGFVYRGAAIPALAGTYVYGDYCEGVVRGLRLDGEEASLGLAPGSISSFGEDLAGELYVLALEGGVYRLDPA